MARVSRTYQFERAALDDLRQGVFWYEDRRPGLGARFAAEVERAMAVVASGPARWPLRNGTHRYVLRGFPYAIAYRTVGADVIVVAIAHHRLDPGSWDRR